MKEEKKTTIVGIGGGSGSGKTTFVKLLLEVIGEENLCLIHHDSYYKDRSGLSPEARADINYDHPSALDTSLLAGHLEQLKNGKEIEVPVYNFCTHCRGKNIVRVSHKPLVLVEGILVLTEPMLLEYFDFTIFIDLDPDLLLSRRVKRDITERGRTVEASLRQYDQTTRPMLYEFVLPSRKNAHLILSGEKAFEPTTIDIIGFGLKSLMNQENHGPDEKK